MPRGHEHNPFSIYERLLGHFFFKLSWNKIVMGKKIVVPCLATSFPGFSSNHPTGSGRKNVLSMRELFGPDPLAGFEKMAGFQIFYCLKIKCFHS